MTQRRILLVSLTVFALISIAALTAGSTRPPVAAHLTAAVASPLPLQPGDTVSYYGVGCVPHATEKSGIVTVRCPAFTPTPSATATLPPSTPTVAPSPGTLTPVPSVTLSAIPSPTMTLTPSDTVTASPPTASVTVSPFSLGIRLAAPEAQTSAFWNAHAQTNDTVYAGPSKAALLVANPAGQKVIYIQPGPLAPQLAIATANRIPYVELNDETSTDCATLVATEQATVAQVHAAGLRFVYSPKGQVSPRCAPSFPMLQNTDVIIFQTEWAQGLPNYDATVKADIHALRAIRSLPIWVQVSVNPPANRALPAADVVATIQALEDGQGDNPEEVHIYFDEGLYPGSLARMEAVLTFFRS